MLVGLFGRPPVHRSPPLPSTAAPAAVSSDIARLAAATEARVQQIEAAPAGPRRDDRRRRSRPGSHRQARLRHARSAASCAQGGPFDSATQADPTFKSLFTSWKKLDNIADGAIAVPSDKPVKTAEFTSGYGIRSDPFRGGAARHQGIDLAAPVGTPIYATADGTVSEAGYNSGGYGNLVKLDHGRGIETRYGHLSAILVQPGQRVTRGQQIGRMGSTGRSTGSHLHYEVRIDGRAVNPIPFMKSNDYLLAMQKNGAGTHSMDAVALGGPSAEALSLPPRRPRPYLADVTHLILSPSAAKRVAFIAGKQGKPAVLRLSVDGGGCAGFSYRFELGEPEEGDAVAEHRRRQPGGRSGQPRPASTGSRGRLCRGSGRRVVQGDQPQRRLGLRLRIQLFGLIDD